MNLERRPLTIIIALGVAPIASAVIDISEGELFDATCKTLFGFAVISFAYFFEKISPWKLFSLGLILVVSFFLFLFEKHDYKQRQRLLTPHALPVSTTKSCSIGQRGIDGSGQVACECFCSGRYEDEQNDGLYDTKGLIGCKSTYWLCQGRPTGQISVISP